MKFYLILKWEAVVGGDFRMEPTMLKMGCKVFFSWIDEAAEIRPLIQKNDQD